MAFVWMFSAANEVAEVPPLIPVQGVLSDSDGQALDGDYELTFRIYDSLVTTTPLWTETQSAIPVEQGFFSVYLGDETELPIDVFVSAGELWLSMIVGAEELSRVQLASVPFALEAQVCRKLGDLTASQVQAGCSEGDGDYYLDPDGTGPLTQIFVTCDMTTGGGGWTVLDHDHEDWTTDDSYENHDCKVFDVTYEVTDAHVLALADLSTEITQTFSKQCYSADMDCSGAETHMTNISGTDLCPHDVLGEIFECNNNDPIWRQDDIILTKANDLAPLKSLWGGDSGGASEQSLYQVGKLIMR